MPVVVSSIQHIPASMLRTVSSASKSARKHASKLVRPISTTATNGANHSDTSGSVMEQQQQQQIQPTHRRMSPFAMSPFFSSSPMSSMFREFEQEMNQLLAGFDHSLERPSSLLAVDVKETDKAYTITADLPGVAKEDVKIKVSPENVMTIAAERHSETDSTEGNFHRVERSYGSFSRSFRLPEHVDVSSIAAKCADGVLTLTVPKLDEVDADKTVHVAVE